MKDRGSESQSQKSKCLPKTQRHISTLLSRVVAHVAVLQVFFGTRTTRMLAKPAITVRLKYSLVPCYARCGPEAPKPHLTPID